MLKWLDDRSPFTPKTYDRQDSQRAEDIAMIFAMQPCLNPLEGRPCRVLTFLPI